MEITATVAKGVTTEQHRPNQATTGEERATRTDLQSHRNIETDRQTVRLCVAGVLFPPNAEVLPKLLRPMSTR